MSRIDSISVHPQYASAERPSLSASDLILRGLQRTGDMVVASITFQAEGAYELRTLTGPDGTIGPVERSWLVRTAAAYAPLAVVTSPPEIVQEIVDTLARAASPEVAPEVATEVATQVATESESKTAAESAGDTADDGTDDPANDPTAE